MRYDYNSGTQSYVGGKEFHELGNPDDYPNDARHTAYTMKMFVERMLAGKPLNHDL